jgi:hypothetical protein
MLLSRRTQAWIIARMMRGEEVQVRPEQLSEPWSRYAEWMLAGPGDETPDERLAAFVRDWAGDVEEHEVNLRLICAEAEKRGRYPSIDEYLERLPEPARL